MLSREIILVSTSNKVQQLIDIVCKYIAQKVSEGLFNHLIVVTGINEVPKQVLQVYHTFKNALRKKHEEAYIILIQQY